MTGFLRIDFNDWDDSITELLKKCKVSCDELIVGIPDNEVVWKINGSWPLCPYEGKEWYLHQTGLVDRIVKLDMDTIKLNICYEKYLFDIFFYGSEYGRLYKQDYDFLTLHKVKVVSCVSNNFSDSVKKGQIESLRWKLTHSIMDQKIILFGVGTYFHKYMDMFGREYSPIYAIDNDSQKWGTVRSGIHVYSPEILKNEDLNKILIVICCRKYKEIVNQIEKYGSIEYRILTVCDYIAVVEEYSVFLFEENIYLRRAHSILMKLMKELDRVCTKYNIKYYVISGSLIGVIRHKGLIPWDDDIDVAMTREDFEKLKNVIRHEWNEERFVLIDYQNIGDDVFYDFMTRIVYTGEEIPTGLFRNCGKRVNPKILNRMVLDIYVLDNSYGGLIHKIVTSLMSGVYALCLGHRVVFDLTRYDRLGGMKQALLKFATHIGKSIPLSRLFIWYEKLRTYAKNGDTHFYFESGGVIKYMPWLYEKKLYGEGTRLPMNDLDVMIPSDYHGLLNAKNYGDYMNYPPIGVRKPSHTILECKVIW